MRSALGLLGLIVTLLIGLQVYRSAAKTTTGETAAKALIQTADIVGVRNDLIAMANAERAHMALNGRYAPLQELFSNGDLRIDPSREREGYVFTADVSDNAFVIRAAYQGSAKDMPDMSINQIMQIAQE